MEDPFLEVLTDNVQLASACALLGQTFQLGSVTLPTSNPPKAENYYGYSTVPPSVPVS